MNTYSDVFFEENRAERDRVTILYKVNREVLTQWVSFAQIPEEYVGASQTAFENEGCQTRRPEIAEGPRQDCD